MTRRAGLAGSGAGAAAAGAGCAGIFSAFSAFSVFSALSAFSPLSAFFAAGAGRTGLGGGRGLRCRLGGRLGGFARARLGGFALEAGQFLALAALFLQLFLLAAQQLGLLLGLQLATLQLGMVDDRRGRHFVGRRVVALDEGALLANLDLDRAGLAARIGLLDLAGRLAGERDLLALAAGRAVRGAQVIEQAFPCPRRVSVSAVDAFLTPADCNCSSSAVAERLSSRRVGRR
jgi:hypothetical protein